MKAIAVFIGFIFVLVVMFTMLVISMQKEVYWISALCAWNFIFGFALLFGAKWAWKIFHGMIENE